MACFNDSARHLSSRFNLVIVTFVQCTETFSEVPATFSRVTPSTNSLCLPVSISVTFPSTPEKSPRIIRTVSPALTGNDLLLYVVLSSVDKGAASSLCFFQLCAVYRMILCLLGRDDSVVGIQYHTTMFAMFATLGHLSAASRATGPLISVPLSSPSGVMMTAALSSNWTLRPSGRLKGLF